MPMIAIGKVLPPIPTLGKKKKGQARIPNAKVKRGGKIQTATWALFQGVWIDSEEEENTGRPRFKNLSGRGSPLPWE